MLSDLNAAFDIIDHNILLDKLENVVGLMRMVLSWLRSSLTDRVWFVDANGLLYVYYSKVWCSTRLCYRPIVLFSIYATSRYSCL